MNVATPCFGTLIQRTAGRLASDEAEAGEHFDQLVCDVRDELRNEIKRALAGERQFVPSYTIDMSGRTNEKLVSTEEALIEALEHGQNTQVLISMLSGRGANVVNLITLREGVIDAYASLNCEQIAQARWSRLS